MTTNIPVLLEQSDFKYVVVKTNYTARLTNTFNFVYYAKTNNGYIETNEVLGNKKYIPKLCYTCGKENCGKCGISSPLDVLFIYDRVAGHGLYAKKNIDLEKYGADIELLIKSCGDGFIVFDSKNTSTYYVDLLKQYNYCKIDGEYTIAKCLMLNNMPFAMIYEINMLNSAISV